MRRLIAKWRGCFYMHRSKYEPSRFYAFGITRDRLQGYISRANGDNRQDAIYKASRLKEQFGEYLANGGEIIFWDDKQDIRETLKNDLGIICVDPQIYNGVKMTQCERSQCTNNADIIGNNGYYCARCWLIKYAKNCRPIIKSKPTGK